MIRNPQFFGKGPKIVILVLTFGLIFFIGALDSLTGPELPLSAFYLVPIILGTYYGGLLTGTVASLASILAYLMADQILAISYSRLTIPYWNAVLRLLLFLTVTYTVAKRKYAEERLSQSEERFRLLVEGAKDYAIVMLDSDGQIVSWNFGAERIYGYHSADVLHKYFSCFYSLGDRETRKPENDLRQAEVHGQVAEEGWRLRKNGSLFWADVVITPIRRKNAQLTGFSMVARDITERMKAEEAVRLFAELHEIDRAILAASSSEKIASEALDRMQKLVPFQMATVTLFDLELGQGSVIALMPCKDSPDRSRMKFLIDAAGYEETESLNQGEILYVEDKLETHILPFLFALPSEELRSYIIVPLLSRTKLVGSLNLGKIIPHGFEQRDQNIAREIANQIALAIHNAQLFEELRGAHQRLQMLSQRLLEVQEGERRHLARELHDEMGQALTALRIQLEQIESSSEAFSFRPGLQDSILIIERILEQVRNLSLDLRPLILDDLGLVAALRWYASRKSKLGGFVAHFTASSEEVDLPSDLETACFRVAQEALTNIVRHARASHVNVELLHKDQEISLLIKDDGIGFDVQQVQQRALQGESLGLLGMRERILLVGGRIEIESVPLCGTEIRVNFVLSANDGVAA